MLGNDPMSVALFYALVAFAILLAICAAFGLLVGVWALARLLFHHTDEDTPDEHTGPVLHPEDPLRERRVR